MTLFKLGKLEYILNNKQKAEYYYKKSFDENSFNLQCINELMKINLENKDIARYKFYEKNLKSFMKINNLD